MEQASKMQRIGPADLDLLVSADPRLAESPAHRQHIGDLLGAGLSWAAMAQGTAAGFAVITRHFFGFPFVDLLLVAEPARRTGLGLALLEQCAHSHDADRIFTSTNESNDPMRRLLAKADWSVSGVVENLDPGDPELVFVKFRDRG